MGIHVTVKDKSDNSFVKNATVELIDNNDYSIGSGVTNNIGKVNIIPNNAYTGISTIIVNGDGGLEAYKSAIITDNIPQTKGEEIIVKIEKKERI